MMKHVTRWVLVLILLMKIQFLFGQTKKAVEQELAGIAQFFMQNAIHLELEYEQLLKGETSFKPFDRCQMFKEKDQERVIFKDYETLKNDSVFIKISHTEQKLYCIRSSKSEDGNASSGLISTFDDQFYAHYKIEIDTIKSDIGKGVIHFEGLSDSPYRSLELTYDPKTSHPISYQINYNQKVSPQLLGVRINFRLIEIMSGELTDEFSTEQYVNIEKGELSPILKYKDYSIIKNF